MDASCSKDVSSSSKFSESFTESDESVYSETSSESDSDSYYSDEYYENYISQDLSAAADTQNQNNDDQWIQVADQASDIIPTAIDFLLSTLLDQQTVLVKIPSHLKVNPITFI